MVNRVGDFGLSLAIMMMFATLGTFTFEGVNATIGQADSTTVTWIGLALLLAACGKSAQFPLQSWLPGRHGGPDPGLGPDPRGHHGHRRRLPDRALAPRSSTSARPRAWPSSSSARSRC